MFQIKVWRAVFSWILFGVKQKKCGNFQELRGFAQKYYLLAKEVGFWAAQDCMSLDGIPYIGRYSKNLPNCFGALGFNKWAVR